MTDNEFSVYTDFKKKLSALDEQTLSVLCKRFSDVNCDEHNTLCKNCPLCLGGSCIIFMLDVEKCNRILEHR